MYKPTCENCLNCKRVVAEEHSFDAEGNRVRRVTIECKERGTVWSAPMTSCRMTGAALDRGTL